MADEIEETAKAVTTPKDVVKKIDDILRRLEALEKALFGAGHVP